MLALLTVSSLQASARTTAEATGQAAPAAESAAAADEQDEATPRGGLNLSGGIEQRSWGIAAGFRIARIAYPAAEEQVSDFIPLLFYDGDIFYLRGLEGGARLKVNDEWTLSLVGRYRFFDIPADYQNLIRGSSLDAGGRVTYHFNDKLDTYAELMSDDGGRLYSSLGLRGEFESGSWEAFPYATLRFKSAEFNERYFGLDGFTDPEDINNTFDNKIGSGLDLTIGSEIRYHVTSNFYLLGRAQLTTLDSDTRDNPAIDRGTYGEIYAGIAFFNDKTKPLASSLKAKPYLRLSHGWATPSNIGDILTFQTEEDEQNNQLTSIFYGHPIADELFGHDPIDIYITLGYARHHQADPYSQTIDPDSGINTADFAQFPEVPCNGVDPCTISYHSQPVNEFVLGIKAYYNLTCPIHWRLGFAEGISYVDTVTNIEQREMDKKGYRASNAMNYLDFTADLSLGDLFGVYQLNDTFFGIGIHHRSSIFETSSAFGRIKGGSNYNAIYIQQHF